jgi:ComF family protein
MARWIQATLPDTLHHYDLIIPVPIHPWRYWRRHYNQSALIALELSKQLKIPINNKILHQHHSSRPAQSTLSATARAEHSNKRYQIQKNIGLLLEKRSVLLIDDVITTGHTLNRCTQLLKQAGAEHVTAITFARTPSLPS